MTDRPRVAILGFGIGFPRGGGGTARALCYARGLQRNGADVEVIIARPSDHPAHPRNTETRGVHEGIPFRYTCSPTQPASGAAWHMANFRAMMGALPALREFARGGRLDAVLYYGQGEPLTLHVIGRFCQRLGAAFLMDLCEAPFYQRTDARARLSRALSGHGYRQLDGVIPISTYLEEFIRPRLRPGARTLRVPIMVDVERYSEPAVRADGDDGTIAYLGDFGHPGEVTALIEAFGAIARDHPGWRLLLIGDTPHTGIKAGIRAALDAFHLNDRVEMPGAIPHEDVPRWLLRADVMALPRADAEYSRAGFPTKLGEYLATGRPVVATATGDIPRYLCDGEDAYLAPPGDTAAFSARLASAIACRAEAEAIGRKGRETARREFDFNLHGRRLRDFILEMPRRA